MRGTERRNSRQTRERQETGTEREDRIDDIVTKKTQTNAGEKTEQKNTKRKKKIDSRRTNRRETWRKETEKTKGEEKGR